MLTVQEPEKLSSVVDNWIQAGESLALVPTMGNLHAGHMALVERAVTAARRVVVSLYVNPAQFGPGRDLDRYPRTPDSDATRLEAGGCDLLWAPSDAVMYPHGIEQAINFALPAHLTDTLEGVFRPGHFAGVAAVVARLFNQVRPNAVVFGEKDYQQLTLIRHLVGDLGYPISVEAVETVREADGLAMSSRNAYLAGEDRQRAPQLHQVLLEVAAAIRQSRHSPDSFAALEARGAESLDARGFKTEYLAIRRAGDLTQPGQSRFGPHIGPGAADGLRVLVAAWCGSTRLIDNVFVS